ncbi:acyl-coenzyme a oxidase [Scheffersomyces xylosifermentans]|uniref:acyl-coenzyme a oxidase n=1 Tax=Scheffersomyces xylosifermentans TaxID=1304137 RepID=UPI00315D1844
MSAKLKAIFDKNGSLLVNEPLQAKNLVSALYGPTPKEAITEERSHTNWDIDEMHKFIEGSEEKANQILGLYKSLERDPILSSTFDYYDLTKEQEREMVAQRIDRMSRYSEVESTEKFLRRLQIMNIVDPSLGIRIAINLGLFMNCVRGNGTDAQYDYWARYKENQNLKQLYGCFGMTELGHGSNVAGCETTATFDVETDSFIIDTPNISATKWWIGGAAHSATHTVCYARLIVKGKDYGVKTFIVPLRDSDHNLHPGIAIGDIGAKMGRQGVDNGWIQFTDVSIPRFFMLSRWCKVDREGNVTLPPLEQLSYISLLEGRVNMATDSYRTGARFITIALRYSVGRRQFKSRQSDEHEVKLLDYRLHQRRLLPNLALTYAMALGTDRLEKQHKRILEEMEQAVSKNDKKLINKSILDTKSLFIDSGSLKSTLTWLAANLIDEARQSCGGHGYHSYNGFGKSFNDWVVQCTWEGDNNVLAMSVGKTLVKNVEQVLKGRNISTETLSFLNNSKELINKKIILGSEKDVHDVFTVKLAVQSLIAKYSASLVERLKKNKDWDLIGPQRVALSKLRAHYYLLETFEQRLQAVGPTSELGVPLGKILKLYYVTSILVPFASEFISFGVVSNEIIEYTNTTFASELCLAVRPYAIGYTDSFKQPDNITFSLIGKYDGDIYENYFTKVKSLNPPRAFKAPYSDKLEDMLNRQSLEERDRFEKSKDAKDILSK